jgi:MFS family permease
MLATGLSLTCGVAAFGYAAPLLATINADLGPDPLFVWVSLVYNVTLSVGLVLVGRLSDIFGRRYFFIGGQVIAVLGCIVCAKATSVPMLIGELYSPQREIFTANVIRWKRTVRHSNGTATQLPFRYG